MLKNPSTCYFLLEGHAPAPSRFPLFPLPKYPLLVFVCLAAITEDHRLGGLTSSSGGWTSKTKVCAGSVSPESPPQPAENHLLFVGGPRCLRISS